MNKAVRLGPYTTPTYITGTHLSCSTRMAVERVKILDAQKRHSNYAYLIENEAGLLMIAWPDVIQSAAGFVISLLREIVGRPIEVNPNVSILDKCFTSRIYIPF